MTATLTHPRASAARPTERPATAPDTTTARPHLLLGAVLAVAASLLVQFAAARFPVAEPTRADAVATATTTAALLAALACLALRGRPGLAAYPLLGALPTAILALPLHGTPLYLGGLASDNQFRTQYVTRYAAGAGLADYNFDGLPPLYPPAWFWLTGRAADLAGVEAWTAYKPAAITTMALGTALAHGLWTRIVRPRLALPLAVATLLSAFQAPAFGVHEPYAWLVVAPMPPLAVLAYRALAARRTPRAALLGCGLYLGLASLTYTLLAAFWAFALTVMAATLARRHGPRTQLLRLLTVAGTALPLILVVWGPYLAAALPAGMPRNPALRFIPVQQTSFPLPMTEVSVTGLLCLAGTVWLLARARRDTLARALLLLVGACYLWCLLSQLAVLAGASLLSFRVHPVLFAALYAAGVCAAAAAVRRLREQARPVAVAAVATVLALSVVQNVPVHLREEFDHARGPRPPADLIRTIGQLTGRPPQDLTVLTDQYRLLSGAPFHGYLTAEPVYAHPLADFAGRTEEVRRWSRLDDPAAFTARLDHGPYDAPDVFVLRRTAGAYAIGLGRDNYPHQPNRIALPTRLPAALFAPAAFARRDVGPYTVLVRKEVIHT
ncbi:arabinofuranosyltransferase [Streptomyces indicus]|uniref:Galactan 5-O-arabinofuranosyltransferase n=1 Tax=Streptomyces indicus TaxID=417292 RepID=A0A1G8VV62_9ACTN|nr:arabinofuranosyltransferase [Streptomyces indicus]SDJ69733.1 galactan 5-O-arabinofuranosyltransferase [Streptomyces indicus]